VLSELLEEDNRRKIRGCIFDSSFARLDGF
jgi:hypothetical protein